MEEPLSRRVVGRICAALFMLCGALVASISPLIPGGTDANRPAVFAVAFAAVVCGAVLWFLPWERWSPRASLWTTPCACLLIAGHNLASAGEPYRYSLFFVVALAWTGLCHPVGWSTRLSPVIAAGYLAPMLFLDPRPAGATAAVLYVVPTCVLVGETVAWVSDRLRKAHLELGRHQERFRSLVQNAADVITVLDDKGVVIYDSPAVERVLGYTGDARVGTRVADYMHVDDLPDAGVAFAQALEAPGVVVRREIRARHADGSWRWCEVVIRNLLDDPTVAGVITNFSDITDRKVAQDRLAHSAYHDGLTGLPNRSALLRRLDDIVAERGAASHVALLFLDLDGFKRVNDNLGHEVGDRLLVAVAERLRGCLGPADMLARFGGDEFTMLLDIGSVAAAEVAAEAVLERMAAAFVVGDRELCMTTSIGVAVGEGHAEDLLRHADLAMYRAKDRGKAGYWVFTPDLGTDAKHRLDMEGDLREALERGQLELRYQPKFAIADGRLVGVEALVRWAHPRRGLLGPLEFIPLAEETGLILPIGRWVLHTATRAVARWQAMPGGTGLGVSVNVSPPQFQRARFLDEVRAAVTAIDDAATVTLEITETLAMHNVTSSAAVLGALKELGVRLSIDDFGTGYSSLSYLQQLPLDELKIDRTFVHEIGDAEQRAPIVAAVVAMAHSLGLSVVAEGVETPEQLACLRRHGCDEAQGFLLGRPVEESEIDRLVTELRPAVPAP